MDRHRFDALTRLLASTGSRRAALGAFLGVSLLGHDPEILAKRGKAKDRGSKAQGNGHSRHGVEGEGRPGARHTQHHQHKQTQRQRRQQRDRRDRHGGQQRGSEGGVCCGDARSCAPPEVGSDRSQCNFDEQAFAGQDLHGTSFRQIAGVGTVFDDADLHDADLTAACLRFATFRGANLADTKWDAACLFAVDFTGADLGESPEALEAAVLCATTLPDGSRSDRDCDQSQVYGCCLPPPGGGGGGEPCTGPADCPDKTCQSRTCTDGKCAYTPVDNGPDPSGQCAHCCRGGCCNPGATSCNPAGLCCVPNCAGKTCGPDGCGTGGTCGTCPAHLDCDDFRGRCVCDGRVCRNGCCASDASCQPGNTDGACGTNGAACQACPGDTACRDGRCACTSSRACGSGLECVDGRCVCTAQSCANGCCFGGVGSSGPCLPSCEPGFECRNGECVCTAQSCPGCCNPGGSCLPGNTPDHCGTGGGVCQRCAPSQICGNGQCLCTPQSCANGCCAGGPGNPGVCLAGNEREFCGTGGARCLNCAGSTCRSKRCEGCSPPTCMRVLGPQACCLQDEGCMLGTTDQICGSDSGMCVACAAGQHCINGRCRCTPQAGCQFGQTCLDGACICNPDACAQINGCCAADGTCQTGNTRQNCGAGGGSCATCRQDQVCFNGLCQS